MPDVGVALAALSMQAHASGPPFIPPHAQPTIDRAIDELKRRGFVKGGQLVAIVQSGRQPIWRSSSTHSIAVRQVPRDPEPDEEPEEAAKDDLLLPAEGGTTVMPN